MSFSVSRIGRVQHILFPVASCVNSTANNELICSALSIFVEKEEIDYDKLLGLILSIQSGQGWGVIYENIAKVVDAGIWVENKWSIKWLEKVSSLLNPAHEFRSSQAGLGIVFGILSAPNRLGPHSLSPDVMEKIKEIIIKMISNKNWMLESSLTNHRLDESEKKIKGKLSELIKAFVSGPYPNGGLNREQLVKEILQTAYKKWENVPHSTAMFSELKPTNLGIFLGEQLAFALFARMDMLTRLRAISLVLKE